MSTRIQRWKLEAGFVNQRTFKGPGSPTEADVDRWDRSSFNFFATKSSDGQVTGLYLDEDLSLKDANDTRNKGKVKRILESKKKDKLEGILPAIAGIRSFHTKFRLKVVPWKSHVFEREAKYLNFGLKGKVFDGKTSDFKTTFARIDGMKVGDSASAKPCSIKSKKVMLFTKVTLEDEKEFTA